MKATTRGSRAINKMHVFYWPLVKLLARVIMFMVFFFFFFFFPIVILFFVFCVCDNIHVLIDHLPIADTRECLRFVVKVVNRTMISLSLSSTSSEWTSAENIGPLTVKVSATFTESFFLI